MESGIAARAGRQLREVLGPFPPQLLPQSAGALALASSRSSCILYLLLRIQHCPPVARAHRGIEMSRFPFLHHCLDRVYVMPHEFDYMNLGRKRRDNVALDKINVQQIRPRDISFMVSRLTVLLDRNLPQIDMATGL